jgi:NADH-quinone oxidoreductase subunit J
VTTVVWFCASVAAILTAGLVVTQKNPFISAIALLGNLASLATLYLLLQADFVAAAQVIVYAGAVMVMFLFVIAYIGPRAELGERRRGIELAASGIAATAILIEILLAVGRSSLSSPAAVHANFGAPQTVGTLFLTRYVGAFEIVSLLLLVAAVAAVVLGGGPRPPRVALDERQRRVGEARSLAAARESAE